jgi:hypothetical protein
MTVPNSSSAPETPRGRGCLPALVRMSWIFGGIALLYCALFIAQGKGGFMTEAVFLFLTALIILVRFVDIRFLEGETLDNKPANLKHWRRFGVLMLAAAAALYAIAKLVAQKNWL